MSECFAGLVYGLNVRVCDLVVSQKAHSQAEPTLTALKLIQRLRQRGTIRVRPDGPRGIVDIPNEVWLMVEQGVIDSAVEQGRIELSQEVICEGWDDSRAQALADEWLGDEADEGTREKMLEAALERIQLERDVAFQSRVWSPDWLEHGLVGCEPDDREWLADVWLNAIVKVALHSNALVKLLATFGLYLPIQAVLGGLDQDRISDDSTALAAILFKTRLQSHKTVIGPDSPAALDLCPSAFTLDSRVDARFRRFLRQYHVTTQDASCAPTTIVGQHEVQHQPEGPIKSAVPRWMLVAKAE